VTSLWTESAVKQISRYSDSAQKLHISEQTEPKRGNIKTFFCHFRLFSGAILVEKYMFEIRLMQKLKKYLMLMYLSKKEIRAL
jgi:hypothetical protein